MLFKTSSLHDAVTAQLVAHLPTKFCSRWLQQMSNVGIVLAGERLKIACNCCFWPIYIFCEMSHLRSCPLAVHSRNNGFSFYTEEEYLFCGLQHSVFQQDQPGQCMKSLALNCSRCTRCVPQFYVTICGLEPPTELTIALLHAIIW